MNITERIPLVTGANRGLGEQLVTALLAHGVPKLYAAGREPDAMPRHPRIVPLRLDLADAHSIQALPDAAPDVDLLVNNAAAASFANPMSADLDAVAHELTVNFLGTYALIRAMMPSMAARSSGAVVNVLSMVALAPAPLMTGYSASKAALHSLTLSLRSELRGRGISVHGVYPGGIDTRMLHGYEMQKTEPRIVAEGILAGLARDEEDIFPDRLARALSQIWLSDPKALERRFA